MNVLCASKGDRQPQGLQYIPGGYEFITDTAKPWSRAANNLLDIATNRGGDALFLDDDITLTPHTFMAFERYRHSADIIGFTLCTPDGAIQSAGHVLANVQGAPGLIPQQSVRDLFQPCYLAHVTASCFWLSERLLQSGLRFPEWEGQHYEDVALTIDAWRQGFKVMYLPGVVIHDFNGAAGAGATKSGEETFQRARAANEQRLKLWYEQINLTRLCVDGHVPVGTWEVTP